MSNISSLSDCSYQMLCEMNSKAHRLCELMKKGIVAFVFKKKSNGKIRKAHGTLKRDLIPQEAQRKKGRPKKRPDDLVIYYDTDKQAIRSFKDYLLQKIYQDTMKKTDISKVQKDVNLKDQPTKDDKETKK